MDCPEMPTTIYTLGYQKRSLDEFIRIARGAGIDVLIDVRETAWSHKPGFSKSRLASALERAGIEYVHAAFAGNPKWLRDSSENHSDCLSLYKWYLGEFDEISEALERLLSDLLVSDRRVALTCYERHAGDCHRSILAEQWVRRVRARRVEHLATDGCPRLTLAKS
jgi:uncharacterized protein (DUF488 family)